jgi:hypothetical protein
MPKSYAGDSEYHVYCGPQGGGAVAGDDVRFERASFNDYGKDKQQHTFSLLAEGKKTRIKGANLYRNGLWRKSWADEASREAVLHEKQERARKAQGAREVRKVLAVVNVDPHRFADDAGMRKTGVDPD